MKTTTKTKTATKHNRKQTRKTTTKTKATTKRNRTHARKQPEKRKRMYGIWKTRRGGSFIGLTVAKVKF